MRWSNRLLLIFILSRCKILSTNPAISSTGPFLGLNLAMLDIFFVLPQSFLMNLLAALDFSQPTRCVFCVLFIFVAVEWQRTDCDKLMTAMSTCYIYIYAYIMINITLYKHPFLNIMVIFMLLYRTRIKIQVLLFR